jgi:hypothetical protein
MSNIAPGNVPPEPPRGPSAGGERLADRGYSPRDDKFHPRSANAPMTRRDTATGQSVDNRLEGHGAPQSSDMQLDHGSLRGGREDRK